MIAEALARAAVLLTVAVLIGLVLQAALVKARLAPPRSTTRAGAVLLACGVTALLVAFVHYGQTITTGVALAFLGASACTAGVMLIGAKDV